MKKITTALLALAALLAVTGCPSWESGSSLSKIRIFMNGKDVTQGITIERGQTVTLQANVGANTKSVSIVWENNSANKEKIGIVNTGAGRNCSLKGKETGDVEILVKAWRSGEAPKELELPITVIPAEVTNVSIKKDKIGVGEKRILAAEITPAWAAEFPIDWSADPAGSVKLEETGGIWTIEGLAADSVMLTAEVEGKEFEIPLTVADVDTLTGLEIYLDNTIATGETVSIGVFEEKFLSARIEPAGAFTFFEWASSDSTVVTVDQDGIIKGIDADKTAVISVTASGFTKSITVQVANPVQGVRIKYNNTDELTVTNVIWLYPNDSVNLKVDLMPAGISFDSIDWSGGEGLIDLSTGAGGTTCTITGSRPDTFESPPIMVRVSARNAGNGNKPASAVLQVKVLDGEPIWAWDRARDADENAALKAYGEELMPTGFSPPRQTPDQQPVPGLPGYQAVAATAAATTANDQWNLIGRGLLADEMKHTIKRVKVPYTPRGLNMCSVVNTPSYDANTCIWVIGSNDNRDSSASVHIPGLFNFYTQDVYEGGELVNKPISRQIRVSVDFEVLSSNGRQLGIHINNTTSTNANSPLSTSNRLAYRAINEARGTKITYVTYLDAQALIAESNPAINTDTLKNATVNFMTYSDGANILISGVRIEYED